MSETHSTNTADLVTEPERTRIVLLVERSACFDAIAAVNSDMSGITGRLGNPLLAGQMPDFLEAVGLAAYGVEVESVGPARAASPAHATGAAMREGQCPTCRGEGRYMDRDHRDVECQVICNTCDGRGYLSSPAPEGEALTRSAAWKLAADIAEAYENNGTQAEATDMILAALSSAPEGKAAQRVEVKALEWRDILGDTHVSETVLGIYRIEDDGASWNSERFRLFLAPNVNKCCKFDTLDGAKAAAQADFDRRIRSALAPPSVKQEGVVRGVDEIDITSWGVFMGHAIPVKVARFIAAQIGNRFNAARQSQASGGGE